MHRRLNVSVHSLTNVPGFATTNIYIFYSFRFFLISILAHVVTDSFDTTLRVFMYIFFCSSPPTYSIHDCHYLKGLHETDYTLQRMPCTATTS